MRDGERVLDADLSYAVRVFNAGYTAEQAAKIGGIPLLELQATLRALSSSTPPLRAAS
jgi:hypothetical protein